jgi:hypothetical protein
MWVSIFAASNRSSDRPEGKAVDGGLGRRVS